MSRAIASRSSWGASQRDGVGRRPIGRLEKYLHHSVTRHLSKNATVAEERAEMRRLEEIGQQRFGRGISYTIAIFPSGRIYWGASIDRIAYHSGSGRNTAGAGFVFVGNTHANDVTPEQEDSTVWALRHGVREGWWGDPAITEGHRDFRATSCPGDYAYTRIDRINERARGGSYDDFAANGLPDDDDLGGNAPARPATPTTPVSSGGGKSVSQMATEVIAGQHGNGHDTRRRSLGVSASVYAQVRAEVNRRAGGGSSAPRPAGKSVAQMAAEVIAGQHGNGHANRRRSLGVNAATYAQVRAEVNRRAGGGGSSGGGGKSVAQMATEVIRGDHGNGHDTRRRSLGVSAAVYEQVRAEVNRRA